MKTGFTLIELLAVIVILAIIALIAVPIVLNIVNDAKESAQLRSAEMYMDGVEQAIIKEKLTTSNFNPTSCNIDKGNLLCDGVKVEVEVKGEKPTDVTITFEDGNIKEISLKYKNEKEITKNSKNEMVYVKFLDEVCDYVSGTPKTAGAKYKCKVDPNREAYTFYVLTTPSVNDTSINLIMDQNINSDGTPAGKIGVKQSENPSQYNLVAWVKEADYGTLSPYDGEWCYSQRGCVFNDKGPLTAMNFLSEATKNWTNTNEMTINKFSQCNYQGCSEKTMTEYVVNARMPIYLSDETKSEVSNQTENNAYLYENLNSEEMGVPRGYWILSATSAYPDYAYHTFWIGEIWSVDTSIDNDQYLGVRPVINLKI